MRTQAQSKLGLESGSPDTLIARSKVAPKRTRWQFNMKTENLGRVEVQEMIKVMISEGLI